MLFRFLAYMAALLLVSTFAADSCDAQTLLRRLRSRVESRIESYLPPEPAESSAERRPAAPVPDAPVPAKPPRTPGLQPVSPISPPAGGGYGSSILAAPGARAPSVADPTPSLGIEVLENRTSTGGLTVTSIDARSRADDAGLRQGDVIVAMDGKPTPTVASVSEHLQSLLPGTKRVLATVVRGDATSDVSIPLVATQSITIPPPLTPAPSSFATEAVSSTALGIGVGEVPGRRGLIVKSVQPGSPAAAAGLKVNDRIVSVGGRMIANRVTLDREFQRSASDETLSIKVVRDGALIAAELSTNPDEPTSNPAADPKAIAVDNKATEVSPSALGGLGSVLGGFFGSANSGSTSNRSTDRGDAPAALEPAASKPPAQAADVMEFGDDEPIEQAVFESSRRKVPVPPIKDPPSLQMLRSDVPPDRLEPITSKPKLDRDRAIEDLREEIERLRQRLEELEDSE